MSTGTIGSSSYYRNRAICRKIAREGTNLRADGMTTLQIEVLLHQHVWYVRCAVQRLDLADVQLARAVIEMDDLVSELIDRGEQLRIPGV